LDQVTKRYADGTVAVHALDLEVADGELMVLVGPSGCGKSTTLRMVAGLEQITEGELRIGGKVVNEEPPRKRDIAMVFQSYALYPHMTVAKNIGFALRRAGMPKDEVRRRVESAAELLGITEHLERKPSQLSGGQRQRVAMGRAIVREASVFLLDEPLSNLDAKLRGQMRAEIARIQRRVGAATIYVTHDQTEAMTLGDRIAVLLDGHLQQVGTPDEVYTRPRNVFVAGFIGAPAMNFLTAEIEDDALKLPLGALPIDDELRDRLGGLGTGDRVILGVRPEDLEDARIAGAGLAGGGGAVLRATADVVESTGSDVLVHVALPASAGPGAEVFGPDGAGMGLPVELVARCHPDSRLRSGDAVELVVDTAKAQLFDATTHDRLAARGEPALAGA
jgi:multiple sugar transport system ATP-binding protein